MDNKLSPRAVPKLSDEAPEGTHGVVIEIVKPD